MGINSNGRPREMRGDRGGGDSAMGEEAHGEEETLMTSKLRALDGSEPVKSHRLCEECSAW